MKRPALSRPAVVFVASALVMGVGCGARTALDPVEDTPDGSVAVDVPVRGDVPVPPTDTPVVFPDVPVTADVPPVCSGGGVLCGGRCVRLDGDGFNCGACGHVCASGQSCLGGLCMALHPVAGPPFHIASLGATVCRTALDTVTMGGPSGQVAVGTSGLYVSTVGDTNTGLFDPETLAGTVVSHGVEGLTSNLHTGALYVLAQGTMPFGRDVTVADHLLTLDPVTLSPVGQIPLTLPIPLPLGSRAVVGVFAGYDRIVVHTGTRVYNIDLPGGAVTDVGAMPVPPHGSCAGPVYVGVAEFYRGSLYLDVLQGPRVLRVRVPDGAASTVAVPGTPPTHNACGFSVSPALGRWYWHSGVGDSVSSVGYCDAVFDLTSAPTPYTLGSPPADVGWVDACRAPGARVFLNQTDDGATTDTLPFTFRYWSTVYAPGQPITLCSNGWMAMDGVNRNDLSGTIPDGSFPHGVIAPHWGDNYTRTPGICTAVTGTAPARSYVVEWNDAHYCCMDDPAVHLSFEAILHEGTQVIDLLYASMAGARPETVGIASPDGSDGVSVCVAGGSCPVTTGTRLRFSP